MKQKTLAQHRGRLNPVKPGTEQRSRFPRKPAKAAGTDTPQPSEPARIQKVMAAAGLGSRRALETQIKEGKVLVNGKVATLGQS